MNTIRVATTGRVGAYCPCGYRLGEAYGPASDGGYAVSLGASWSVTHGETGHRVWRKSRRRHAQGTRTNPLVRGAGNPVQPSDRVTCPKCRDTLQAPR